MPGILLLGTLVLLLSSLVQQPEMVKSLKYRRILVMTKIHSDFINFVGLHLESLYMSFVFTYVHALFYNRMKQVY
jgi:DNA gyrase/topoisomerase IV subunit B